MKIPALRVEVNGKLVAVAGAKELSLLTGSIGVAPASESAGGTPEIVFSIMGLAVQEPQPRQLTWGRHVQLKQGDRVTFEVVETDQPSAPDQTLATPSTKELAATATAEATTRRKPR